MIELMVIYLLSKHVGAVVRQKGRRPLGYQVLVVLLWFGAEVVGVIIAGIAYLVMYGETEPRMLVLYAGGLLTASASAYLSCFLVRILPAAGLQEIPPDAACVPPTGMLVLREKTVLTSDARELVGQILDGRASFPDLVAQFGDRVPALEYYAETVSAMFPQRPVEGMCEGCGIAVATDQRRYLWRVAFPLGKPLIKQLLLLPVHLLCGVVIPVRLLSTTDEKIAGIRIETYHNLCTGCRRKTVWGGVVADMVFAFSVTVFAISLITTIIVSMFVITAAFGWADVTARDLNSALPVLAAAIIVVALSAKSARRVPVLLTTPSNMRRIERGGFESFTHQRL